MQIINLVGLRGAPSGKPPIAEIFRVKKILLGENNETRQIR